MQPPSASWGTVINDGQELLYTRPWVAIAPGIMIVLTVVALNVLGESVTMMSVMRLIIDPNARFEGEVIYKGNDLMRLSQDRIRQIRGSEMAMIFPDPMTSLNPVYRVGWQIAEQVRGSKHDLFYDPQHPYTPPDATSGTLSAS